MNIIFATTSLLYPETSLLSMVRSPLFITPTTTFLLQTTSVLLYALTTPMVYCIQNTRLAVESRRIVYLTLGAGEVFLIPLLLWKAITREETGLEKGSLVSSAMTLVPILAWRTFTLWKKPEWFGVVEYEKTEEKKKNS